VMVYRCLHDRAPRYLADHLIPASDAAPRRLRLRSANLNRLTVPRCRLSSYGCRAFYHAGPTVCNSLPDKIRTDLIVLNDSRKQFYSAVTSVTSAVEV